MQEVVERSEENGPDTNALVPHLAQGQDHMSARQVVQDGANCMSSAGLHAECSGNGTGGLGSLQKIAADVEDTEKLADGGNEDEGNDGQSASLSRLKGKVLHTHKPRSMNAPRRLHKDSASWCWFCKHVFWSGITVEDCDGAAPSFCTLCGSKLLPGARDAGSYSRLAQTTDDEIMSLMRKEVAKEGGLGAVEKFSHPGVGLPELREQIETMSLSCRNQANGKDRPRSNFCDICGHGGTHIQCSRCPASFHRTCMVLPANYPLPKEGWWCSACMHEAVRSEEIKPLTLVPRACKRTLPSIAQCCSSCGYPEIESLNCDACSRWFCYGCMCVSHECVPAGAWACPECIGQKVYDENLSERIRISRERWVAGKMSAKERDGFSQMVFDLLCSCAWGEWKVNVEALITDNCARLARDASYLPTILPFQSLHYPLPKGDMMKISQAYAKVVQLKAHRAYRSAETRTKWAEEGEEVRRKGEDGGRAADEKGIRACSAAASARASPAPPLGDVAVDLSSLGAMPRFRDCEAKGREGEEDDEGAPPAAVALQACEAEDVLGGIGAGSSRVSGHVDNLPAAQQPSKEQPSNGPESVLGVLAARPSSGAPLPEINMWKPELCERTAGRGSAGMPRLRIGYMSSDFVNHPTADLIIRALLLHNTEEFETFCYSLAKDDNSTYRRMLEQGIPNFRLMPKHLSDRKCAEMIAEDGIHILVNLNGHTAGDRNGVCALRPAPLQVVYLAYPGTMGADYIDYNVVDRYVCPDEHREFYTENLLYMPHSYQANSFNDLYREILRPETLPKRSDFMLPEDAFVFCNFCRLGRITEELFQVWLRIMQEVPHSVLWLYKHPRAAMYRLQEAARQTDPALVQRIMFASPCSPKLEHLKRVALADLCLDTTVYNGHTTGSDMLWAGVPMLTVLGDNWPSRVAYCLAQCIDMPEMVVRNLQEYEEAAVRLARDPPTLRRWREKLASKRLSAPLFDTERWVRSFEDGLHQMWDMWANGHHSRQTLGDIVCRDFGESPSAARKRDEYAKFGALRGSPSWTRAGGDSDKDSANPHGYSFGDGLSVPRGAPAVRTSSSRARAGKHDEHRLSKCRTGGAGRERELKDIRHGGNGHVASAPRAGPLASSAGAGASAVPAGAVAQKRLRGRPPQCPTRQHAEPVLGVVQASQNSKRKVHSCFQTPPCAHPCACFCSRASGCLDNSCAS